MSSSKLAAIAGCGSGISAAVARRFAAHGYNIALLGLTQEPLDAAAAELCQSGITAKGFAADLSDAAAVKSAVAAVQSSLGRINMLHWNPYQTLYAPLLSVTPDQLQSGFNVSVTGLLTAVQAAHADLKASQGCVLVTGAGISLETDRSAQVAVGWDSTALAVAKAAQRKLVHILHKGLADDGIYVAELTVKNLVAGTAYDPEGKSVLTPDAVARQFWLLHQRREPGMWFVDEFEGNAPPPQRQSD
ncbi:hypothetical protein OEZ85_004979 [Tetradesmus obliquus]|uniref:Short-chain dehydrogenase/reductase SDR n=1 Tax=Tetradesmus obliquus TaxID=3088 RepID=A0ABY8UGV3_TETOB|nr:hypothetical protein OEZ85_004979 [Tetradesmus obliquus]